MKILVMGYIPESKKLYIQWATTIGEGIEKANQYSHAAVLVKAKESEEFTSVYVSL